MIKFEPSSPFPLLVDPSRHSESEQKVHAAAVDQWLGLKTQGIEMALAGHGCRLSAPESSGEKQQLWLGLDVQQLLTPYTEIRYLLEKVSPRTGETVVDLGAAYGRMGFVMAREFPRAKFVGYEYVGERVQEARRCLKKFGALSAVMDHCDLASEEFEPIAAEIYFVYDFGTPKAIEKALHDLRRVSKQRPIVLVARGRHCRYLIETRHQWLFKIDPSAAETRTTIYGSDQDLSSRIQTSFPRLRETESSR